MKLKSVYFIILFLAVALPFNSYGSDKLYERKGNKISYYLNIDYKTVNLAGKDVQAMLINQTLPGPVLYFREGDQATIYVTNKMKEATSLHWHGILLPNFQDGVPYLTTPPIEPGKTHKFEFPLTHSGTYWYHSHTGLQEQRGVFGGIVVKPKSKKFKYNKDLVLHLSDWSNENPDSIMKTLKRGSEWYTIKKNSAQSLNRIIEGKVLIPQLKMWSQRMPGMDISDVYYDAFLLNGKTKQHYTQFKGGEIVRVRWINSSASTYFWLSLGGKAPRLISADGINVRPVVGNKLLHGVGETYDFLVRIPKGKSIELKAVAQDGSGFATAILGQGPLMKAPYIPPPSFVETVKAMALHHGSGSHGKHKASHSSSSHGSASHGKHKAPQGKHKNSHEKNHHEKHKMSHGKHKNFHEKHKTSQGKHKMSHEEHKTSHGKHKATPKKQSDSKLISYDHLKSFYKTSFSKNKKVKKVHFNLTGNMWRYVWSMNGKVLSEVDTIKVRKGEVLRMTLDNKTMMNHPMHLHGHFFRVLNKHGEYSPLKHTVDVPPMEKVTLEFESDAPGDWFFHCHVLYHMMAGMARIFRNGNQRDKRLKNYPFSEVMDMDQQWFIFSEWDILSNHSELEVVISNTRNQVTLEGRLSWLDKDYKSHQAFESELSYERFLGDYFRLYGEVDLEGEVKNIKDTEYLAKLGFRYLLPFLIDLEVSLDHKAGIELGLDYDLLLFPRLEFFVDWSWRGDFGLLNELPDNKTLEQEYDWFLGLEYILEKSFSLTGRYDNHLGWAGGLNLKF